MSHFELNINPYIKRGVMKMKKGVLVLLTVLFLGSTAFAQELYEEEGSWLQGTYVQPEVDVIIPLNDDLDASVYLSGKIGYELNEWWSIFVEVGWSEMDLSEGAGDVTTVPLLFNVRYTFFPDVYIFDYYIFGGIGYSFNSINFDPDPTVEVDDDFAGQIGAGADYWITKDFSVYLNARFFFSDPDLNGVVLGRDDMDLSSFILGGGIRWRFN
jgi:outer membrane protein W